MTKLHDLGFYQDGRLSVAYCKRCSAEGEKLLEYCQEIKLPFAFKELTKAEIEEKFGVDKKNTLDEKKLPAK